MSVNRTFVSLSLGWVVMVSSAIALADPYLQWTRGSNPPRTTSSAISGVVFNAQASGVSAYYRVRVTSNTASAVHLEGDEPFCVRDDSSDADDPTLGLDDEPCIDPVDPASLAITLPDICPGGKDMVITLSAGEWELAPPTGVVLAVAMMNGTLVIVDPLELYFSASRSTLCAAPPSRSLWGLQASNPL